ncbi:MAG: TauD/TfdA family dioxygenase, partial [Pseudomonadota bacterium]
LIESPLLNMKTSLNHTTRFCVATPSGRGAVATVALRGDSSIEIINRVFAPKRKKPLGKNDFGRIIYGTWNSDGHQGEDLVVCLMDSPGECMVWDNRCLLHRAMGFNTGSEIRVMRRCTTLGETPAA